MARARGRARGRGRPFRFDAAPALRTALGLALLPTSAAAVLSAARTMAGLASGPGPSGAEAPLWPASWGLWVAGPEDAFWFLGGFLTYAGLHGLGLFRLRRFYVLAHELTHALAVWMGGGKVFKLVVKADSGYVDLSRMSPFIALAPYWVPLYALAVIGAYRIVLWRGGAPHAREAFALLLGASLSFHFLHTLRSLWATRQSDLEHAGFVLSMSLIALLNAAVLLAALKCLFPRAVSLADAAVWTWAVTRGFWSGLGL